MRSSFFERFGSRLKSPLLVFLALFLSLSALLNLVPAFLRPAHAKDISLCELTLSPSNCATALMISVKDYSGNETNIQQTGSLYALPEADNYYIRIADATGEKYTASHKPEPYDEIFVFISTNKDFSGTPFSTSLGYCPDNTTSLKQCTDSLSPKLYFFKGNAKVNDQNIPGGIQPNALSSLNLTPVVTHTLKDDTADATVRFNEDGTATVAETNEEGETTEETVETNPDASSGSDSTTTGDITCSKGTSGLGWILCSIGEMVSNLLNTLYEHFIVPALQIRATLFEGQNGTYAVWATFRDIANVLFVIYFLVIIFSQLTGVGIDNYGIKKSLPRLIVAAILINLSYFICQLVIDLSNIVGASLYGFLQNVPIGDGYKEFLDSLVDSDIVSATVGSTSNLLVYVLATAFVLGGIWSIGGVAALGSMAVVPVLSGLIGAAVSIFFMFVLLSFRNAVVVIGVAISPLAFVCYMLPNTKNLYDRWFQIMKGMILLYPICSVVIGGGHLASRIILGSGGANADIFLLISAIVAEVAPYFAVPSLVRAAYKATGRLGMRLERMSMIAPKQAQMGFRHGQFAQNTQDWSNRITTNRRMQRRIDRLGGRTNLSDAQRRRLAEANQYMLNQEKEQQNAQAMTDAANIEALRTQQRIAAAAQLEKNRQYTTQVQSISEATLTDATIQQAVINQEGQLADLVNYADTTYQQGKRAENELSNEADRAKTGLYADATYQQGKRNKNALDVRGDRNGAQLLSDNAYISMREAQQDATVSNETTKMYAESFKNLSVPEIQQRLADAMNDVGGNHQSERINAALQTLLASGSEKEIMQVMAGDNNSIGGFGTVSTNLATAATSNINLRNTVSQQLASSGNIIMKEYGKYMAGGGTDSFKQFVDGGGLAAALAKNEDKALSSMSKDSLDFVSKHMSAVSSLDNKAFANAMATHNSGEENTKLNQILNKLDDTKKGDVISSLTAQQFTLANDSSRSTLRVRQGGDISQVGDYIRGTMGNAGTTFDKQVQQINTNPQLKGQFSNIEMSKYNINP